MVHSHGETPPSCAQEVRLHPFSVPHFSLGTCWTFHAGKSCSALQMYASWQILSRNESPSLTLWCKNCRRWKTFRIKPSNHILVCFLCLHMTLRWESLYGSANLRTKNNKQRRFSKQNRNIEKTKSSKKHIINLRSPVDTRSDYVNLLGIETYLYARDKRKPNMATAATRF